MGQGFQFVCKKCKFEYEVFPGIGMLYPLACRDLAKAIESGKYGKKRQKMFKETPDVRVNAETVVFICDECKCWKEATDLSLYAPDILKDASVKKNDDEYYSMDGYHVVMGYTKLCPKCRKAMRLATDKEINHLTCPRCGAKGSRGMMLMWD